MVARINTSKSLSKVLNYNEHKVREQVAEILHAQNFLKEAGQLGFTEKLRHFERLTSLNERATTNVLHVSLNFDPADKLENESLIEIAEAYMNGIGFSKQPYLVYRHHDAGHMHIHIVSTNIQADGSRISMHNLGRNQSEQIRKQIEKDFGLVKAQEKKLDDSIKIIPVSSQKVAYGKGTTKRAVSNVLGLVINHYKYSSLPELNAVLNQYNVHADRGEKGSAIYEKGGLVFRVLDENKKYIGPPLKASSFYMKPTLTNLQQRFIDNDTLKQPFAKRLKSTIDFTLLSKRKMSLQDWINDLRKQNITVVLRQSNEAGIYGLTYVDHKTRCVFNGGDLGKQYSAKGIMERLNETVVVCERKEITLEERQTVEQKKSPSSGSEMKLPELPESTADRHAYTPYELRKRKRKKKQKKL